MKLLEKHIPNLLAILAFCLIFGNEVAAGNKIHYGFPENGHVFYTFLEDTQEKPYLFDEISIGEASQTTSQNEYFGFGFVAMVYSRQAYPLINSSSAFISSYSLKDKRELIFQYLFPFHFFW